jgi:hypothetical protein
VNEAPTESVRTLLKDDPGIAAWWGSPVECWSAFARRRREGVLDLEGEEAARALLEELRKSWAEIHPSEQVRAQAARLLRLHALRANDALQLAAALAWAGSRLPVEIVVFDRRLRDAARLEGLSPAP